MDVFTVLGLVPVPCIVVSNVYDPAYCCSVKSPNIADTRRCTNIVRAVHIDVGDNPPIERGIASIPVRGPV